MGGPYQRLYIYELEGTLEKIPQGWGKRGYLGCWYEAGYSFVFFPEPSREQLEKDLLETKHKIRSETVIPYQDWEAGVPLQPFCVGSICVAPPWNVPQDPKALLVDPGVSFGSGLHGSTRACLELLVSLYRAATPMEVLDLGTGSGILALAAARLGAQRVTAVDCQPVAVETAKANVARNFLEARVEVTLGNALDYLEGSADLIMANLHLELLLEMLTRPSFWRTPWCILAGLVGRQDLKFLAALEKTPMRVLESREEGRWSAFLIAGDELG